MSSITICGSSGHCLPSSVNLPGDTQLRLDQVTQLGAVYDKKIADLEATLKSMKTARCGLLKEENILRVPICRLPVETLTQIFSIICPDNVITDLYNVPGMLRLSGVCSRFRNICLNSPVLWSSISLVFEQDVVNPYVTLLAGNGFGLVRRRMDTFLSNSADYLLRVRINAYHEFRSDMSINDETLLRSLCRSSPRWSHLTLCCEAADAFSSAMRHYKLSSLTSFTLHPASDRPNVEDDFYLTYSILEKSLFGTASMLESVDYGCCNGDAIALPWKQLTKLCTGKRFWFSEEEFEFQNLRNLKTWRVGSLVNTSVELDALKDTHFQNLTTLSLNKSLLDANSEVPLEYITAPSLVDLSVIDSDLSAGSLVAFLGRSSCHLTSFTICRINFTAEDIIECLRYMPKLRNLSLNEDKKKPFISVALLDYLSSVFQSQENAAFQGTLSALHDLTLEGSFNGCRQALIRMLKSWAAMPGKPSFEEGRRHFEIQIYNPSMDSYAGFVEELIAMDREGLRVSVL